MSPSLPRRPSPSAAVSSRLAARDAHASYTHPRKVKAAGSLPRSMRTPWARGGAFRGAELHRAGGGGGGKGEQREQPIGPLSFPSSTFWEEMVPTFIFLCC